MKFIQFPLKDLDKKEMKYTYSNYFGENPYIKGNYLYFPSGMERTHVRKHLQQ